MASRAFNENALADLLALVDMVLHRRLGITEPSLALRRKIGKSLR